MSFIFRRSEDSGEQAEQDELSRLYLSSTDLFCLLGGPEARLLSCGDIRLPRTNDDNLQRKRDAWLGKLVKRLEPQGWVDVEGNPNDELRNALEALRDPCLVISEHPRYIQPTFVIAVTATGATGLVAAQGPVGWGRWSLRPFPSDDRTIWSAYFRDIVPENSFPFFPAERSYHAAWVEDVPGELLGFIRSGAVRKAREYAARAGIDAGVVGKLAARAAADKEGYKTFVIPDNVGGRFSVLTPVGLLPIACAGFDIKALVNGAADMEKATAPSVPFAENIAAQYAAVRNALYTEKGKKIEIMGNYQPKLHFIAEWWKQLYGESEGKEHKGIFPASCDFTTDLHSMGQWIQEGERSIFETVISVEQPAKKLLFPNDDENLDGLNFLAGKRVDEVNKMAELGTLLAHVDGGVPNIRISVPELNEYYIGQLIYFFEIGCGISGNVLGVNPFNQPGVEAYKKNMFALLDKPGYEAESKAIKERLK